MVDDNEFQTCRLADFGNAALLTRRPLTWCCGSLPFCAPEVLDVPRGGYNGVKADSFSMGVLGYEMVFGTNSMMHNLGWSGPAELLQEDMKARSRELVSMLSRTRSSILRAGQASGNESAVILVEALDALLRPSAAAREDLRSARNTLSRGLSDA